MAQTFPNLQNMPAGAIPVYQGAGSFMNIVAAGNYQARTGSGVLALVAVNTGVSGATVTLFDGTSSAGTRIAGISAAAVASVPYGVRFLTGLFVEVVGTADITITYF